MKTLVIIGATGQLGSQALRAACDDGWTGPIIATYNNSMPWLLKGAPERLEWRKLDCSDHKEVRHLIVSVEHLGALIYCAVPANSNASAKPSSTMRLGIVDDVVNCAEGVVMVGGRFVAISTDLVFDGQLTEGRGYTESSEPTPCVPYGRLKAEMERRLSELSGDVVIARTSLILSMDNGRFGPAVQFVVDCLQGKLGEIELFEDEKRNMSFADDLGVAVVELARASDKGVVHMVAEETSNRWMLAELIAKHLGMEEKLGVFAKRGLSSESGLNRPINCQLDVTRKVFKTPIRGVSERLS